MEFLLKGRDIRKKYGISRQTLYNWRKEGMPFLGSIKTLFYNEEDVAEWLQNRSNADKVEEVVKANYDV